ncbi:MAG TPA: tetratricopeptide repeat protein [Thermoanaerobaculia bacterium]|nr:tetratricopeptide repeat protein [Thermoanaerobaculia bacterium]
MQRPLVVPALLLLLLPTVGCNKIRARAELKNGNALYANEQYKGALTQFQKGLELDPEATFAWRSVGLSALALYKPGDTSPQNVQYAKTATDAFEKYLRDHPDDEKIREYLLSTYVNAKMYPEAMAYLDEQAKAHPNDPQYLNAKVRILILSGQFQEAERMAAQYTGPNRHEIFYAIGHGAYEKVYNDPDLNVEQRTALADTGLEALQRSIEAKPDYFQSLVYYNLMLREKAKMETDANKRMEYLAEADQWRDKAVAQGKKDNESKKAAEAKQSEPKKVEG